MPTAGSSGSARLLSLGAGFCARTSRLPYSNMEAMKPAAMVPLLLVIVIIPAMTVRPIRTVAADAARFAAAAAGMTMTSRPGPRSTKA